jgi:hypothetical protein
MYCACSLATSSYIGRDFVSRTVSVGGETHAFPAFPPETVAILECGGLVGFMQKRLAAQERVAHPR